MRNVRVELIRDIVAELVKEANFVLRLDVRLSLESAFTKENNKRAKRILKAIGDNAKIAQEENLAICQDTGLPVVFVEIGQDVHITGGRLKDAINRGVNIGYSQNYLRKSIVQEPLSRGSSAFIPAVIHTEIVKGDRLKLTVLPKGFGCENKSKVEMFRPTVSIGVIKDFIIKTVKEAGPDACPPFVVGIGIGGTADYAMLLAKKALLEKVKSQKSKVKITSQNSKISQLEKELLRKINKLNIGPMGLGGKTTCLGVKIESYPTHIAGLPVAVNISCHALRSATKEI